jgi:hypothetical protein
MPTDRAKQLVVELQHSGIAVIPDLLTPEQLGGMQRAFAGRLRRLRWNNVDGYEKTEPYRHMVQDVLTLHQGFVDAALHPLVKETLAEYVGCNFALVEAKGWMSVPTRRDFHGWHGDAWYDQKTVAGIPPEVKLGLYLTDVASGAFCYIKGSHGKQAPRNVRPDEIRDLPADRVVEVKGPAGLAFLFDTSGIHRQAAPILEERRAVFFNYHDPRVPLQEEDVAYYRYHPLLLNAAFLGGLSEEDRRILGFGDKTHYLEAFERQGAHTAFQAMSSRLFGAKLRARELGGRVFGKLRRLFRRRQG